MPALSIKKNDEISELLKRIEKNDIPPKIEPLSDEDFVNLCKTGDTKKVKEALKLGANVNAKKGDRIALVHVIEGGIQVGFTKMIEILEILLNNRADANAKGFNGMSALMWAAEHGNAEVAEVLLEHRADVNAKDMDGMTALMYTESAEVAELLLTRGVDVNAKDNHGRTALMWTKNAEVAKLLLEHKADVNAKDKNGTTALMWAAKYGNAEIAELFLTHGTKVNLKKDGAITLMMARNTAVAELLLIQGAKVNVKDENGMTALMWAEERCHTKIANILRTHGAK